eukprot:gene5224-5755_t
MALNPTLEAFYFALYQSFFNEDNMVEVDGAEQAAIIISVAAVLLDLSPTITLEEVIHQLITVHPTCSTLTSSSLLEEIAEVLLFHAVSEHCAHRADCVQLILSLDEDSQLYLMETIKQYISKQPDEVQEEDEEEEEAVSDPLAGSTSSSSATCAQCAHLTHHLDLLRAEVGNQAKAFEKEVNEFKRRLAMESSRLEDCEGLLFQKEQLMADLQKQFDSQGDELKEAKKAQYELIQLQHMLTTLQDEVEVLRPQADRADLLENNLNKLRERLEEMSEVKQQLKVEVNGHQETYSKLVAAELELSELRGLKAQIEQYRSELAEVMITNEDYLKRLEGQSYRIRELEAMNDHLASGQEQQYRQQRSLTQELQQTSEQLRTQTRYQGIGEGISELNPILMQELHKLRTENADLIAKIARCSTDSLMQLEKEIGDVKCINSNLQQKWSQTKDQLQAAEAMIVLLNEQLCTERQAAKEQIQSLQENMQTLQSQYESRLAVETQRVMTISGELEEEVLKRRRLERTKRLLDTELQRLKVQLNGANSAGEGGCLPLSGDYALAAKEMKSMQEQIDQQQIEIASLKQQLHCSGAMAMAVAADSSSVPVGTKRPLQPCVGGSEGIGATPTSGLRARALRSANAQTVGGSATASASQSIQSFIEQTELNEKKLEQLNREKREILSKSLEDNKEKMELGQKLVIAEKENIFLKNELRKVRLEKERLERKLMKEGDASVDKENYAAGLVL